MYAGDKKAKGHNYVHNDDTPRRKILLSAHSLSCCLFPQSFAHFNFGRARSLGGENKQSLSSHTTSKTPKRWHHQGHPEGRRAVRLSTMLERVRVFITNRMNRWIFSAKLQSRYTSSERTACLPNYLNASDAPAGKEATRRKQGLCV